MTASSDGPDPNDGGARRLLVIAAVVLAAVAAAVLVPGWLRDRATPALVDAWVVSASLGDRVASLSPREVRVGEPVTLYAVVAADPGDGPRLFGTVDRVRFGDDGPVREVEPWSEWAHPLEVLWFKVEPVGTFANESGDEGFRAREIRYTETLMTRWGFALRHAADIRPTTEGFPELDVGTMRFKVRAVVRDRDGRILDQVESPGADSLLEDRLEARPHRVGVRGGGDAIGWLQSWAGVPYVPLSPPEAGVAAPGFVGGTVLDFWIAARRRAGDDETPFLDWSELPEHARIVVDEMFLADDGAYYYTGRPLDVVAFDRVRPGDVVTIEDHAGILVRDSGPEGEADGTLNRWDRVLEAYFEPLDERAMGDAFVSGATVWRLGDGAADDGREEGR